MKTLFLLLLISGLLIAPNPFEGRELLYHADQTTVFSNFDAGVRTYCLIRSRTYLSKWVVRDTLESC